MEPDEYEHELLFPAFLPSRVRNVPAPVWNPESTESPGYEAEFVSRKDSLDGTVSVPIVKSIPTNVLSVLEPVGVWSSDE